MAMNEETLKGKWKEIKGEIQTAWGKVTGDELEKAKGNMTSIAGLIQQKYGDKKEDVSSKLDEIVGRYHAKAEMKKEQLEGKVADKTEDVKEKLRQ